MNKRARMFAIAVATVTLVLTAFAGPALAADKFVTMYASGAMPCCDPAPR